MEFEYSLPYSEEAEQAVIGAVIVSADEVLPSVATDLKPYHFYNKVHSAIWREVLKLYENGKPIDYVTVLEVVAVAKVFSEEADAKIYLYSLVQTVPTIKNIKHYAEIVYDKYLHRELMSMCRSVSERAGNEDEHIAEIIGFAEQKLHEIRNGSKGETASSIKKLANEFGVRQTVKKEYLTTGYARLDKFLKIDKGDYVVLAARPSVGKTAFALNIALNMAKKGKRVAFFSLETSDEKLFDRIVSIQTAIDFYKIKNQSMTDDDWFKYATEVEDMSQLPMHIIKASGRTVSWIKGEALRLNAEVIFIDYLGLIKGQGKSRYEIITDISLSLHNLAQQTGMTVMCLSQLNRDANGRKPNMSDLRESGQIEQDADAILMLHRKDNDCDDISVIIEKNKEGRVGTIDMKFYGSTQTFADIEKR